MGAINGTSASANARTTGSITLGRRGLGDEDHSRAGREAKIVRVLIACEIQVVAAGLASLLSSDPRLRILATGGAAKVLQQTLGPPDVVVTDDNDSDETLRRVHQIRAVWPDARILVLGVPAKPRRILECLRAGASAFAFRDLSESNLIEAVVHASRGEMNVSSSLLEAIFADFAGKGQAESSKRSSVDLLTPREVEVFELLNRGFTNAEIAARLNLGSQTVKNYVHHVMTKLQARRRSEIVFADTSRADHQGQAFDPHSVQQTDAG